MRPLTPMELSLFKTQKQSLTRKACNLLTRASPWLLLVASATSYLLWHEHSMSALRSERDLAQQQVQWLLQRRTCLPSETTQVVLVLSAENPEKLNQQLMKAGMDLDTIRLLIREKGAAK